MQISDIQEALDLVTEEHMPVISSDLASLKNRGKSLIHHSYEEVLKQEGEDDAAEKLELSLTRA